MRWAATVWNCIFLGGNFSFCFVCFDIACVKQKETEQFVIKKNTDAKGEFD